jgi:hypothetical protein
MSSREIQSSNKTDYEYPALCIPRALGETTQEEIHDIIRQLKLGDISKIIIKPKEFILPKWERTTTITHTTTTTTTTTSPIKTTNQRNEVEPPQTVSYNNIYIYFKRWNIDNPQVRRYRDNIIKGQTIKIVYKMIPTPIFWRCVAANFTTYNNRNKINNTTDM